jgi:hypothetical protein
MAAAVSSHDDTAAAVDAAPVPGQSPASTAVPGTERPPTRRKPTILSFQDAALPRTVERGPLTASAPASRLRNDGCDRADSSTTSPSRAPAVPRRGSPSAAAAADAERAPGAVDDDCIAVAADAPAADAPAADAADDEKVGEDEVDAADEAILEPVMRTTADCWERWTTALRVSTSPSSMTMVVADGRRRRRCWSSIRTRRRLSRLLYTLDGRAVKGAVRCGDASCQKTLTAPSDDVSVVCPPYSLADGSRLEVPPSLCARSACRGRKRHAPPRRTARPCGCPAERGCVVVAHVRANARCCSWEPSNDCARGCASHCRPGASGSRGGGAAHAGARNERHVQALFRQHQGRVPAE